jgi:hypothetical protein
MNIAIDGGISLNVEANSISNSNEYRPVVLLDGGNHINDFDRFTFCRRGEYRSRNNKSFTKNHLGFKLPREKLLQIIIEKDLK